MVFHGPMVATIKIHQTPSKYPAGRTIRADADGETPIDFRRSGPQVFCSVLVGSPSQLKLNLERSGQYPFYRIYLCIYKEKYKIIFYTMMSVHQHALCIHKYIYIYILDIPSGKRLHNDGKIHHAIHGKTH